VTEEVEERTLGAWLGPGGEGTARGWSQLIALQYIAIYCNIGVLVEIGSIAIVLLRQRDIAIKLPSELISIYALNNRY
jgi:hypothetical protein